MFQHVPIIDPTHHKSRVLSNQDNPGEGHDVLILNWNDAQPRNVLRSACLLQGPTLP